MGCISSKIMTKSGSFKEEVIQVNRSLQSMNGFEELLTSKNGGDQFLALICTANTVARKLKTGSPPNEPKGNPTEPDQKINPSVELAEVETINTWELLAGLEEGNGDELKQKPQHSLHSTSFRMSEEYIHIVNDDSMPSKGLNSGNEKHEGVIRTRSFRTVEDYDAMVTRSEGKQQTGFSESSKEGFTTNSDRLDSLEGENVALEIDSTNGTVSTTEGNVGSRRKAMAKELAVLRVPGFEFSKSGSLREWLLQGGQVFSPGSYVTPKFGDFVSPEAKDGNPGSGGAVFDPEMVSHFERDMKQLTVEEECILQQIVESLEGGNEEGISRNVDTSEHIER